MADDSLLGVHYMKLIAGFAGAVISLAFLKGLSRGEMIVNVAGGCASSAFLAPAIIGWAGLKPEWSHNFTIFLTGLLSMSVLAGVMVIARAWRENPGNAAGIVLDILSRIRGTK